MQTGNRVLLEGTPSWLISFPFYVVGSALLVGAWQLPGHVGLAVAGAGLSLLLVGYAKAKSLRYLVTAKHIEIHEGLLSRDISDVPLNRISHVRCHQSFLMGLLGLGDIELIEQDHHRIILPALRNARQLREQISELIEDRLEFLAAQSPRDFFLHRN